MESKKNKKNKKQQQQQQQQKQVENYLPEKSLQMPEDWSHF